MVTLLKLLSVLGMVSSVWAVVTGWMTNDSVNMWALTAALLFASTMLQTIMIHKLEKTVKNDNNKINFAE